MIPGLGRSSGGGHGNPLQYSCLENSHGQRSLVGYSPWHRRVGHDRVTKHTQHSSTASSSERLPVICMHHPPHPVPLPTSWQEVTKRRKIPFILQSTNPTMCHTSAARLCVCVCVCVCVYREHTLWTSPASLTFGFCYKVTLQHNGSGFTEGKVLSFQNTANAKSRRGKKARR